MLENLEPAKRIRRQNEPTPSVEFDGNEGVAVTPGYAGEPDLDEYLRDAGFDPELVEVIGPMRTSRWQRYDGEWLTSYRFRFRTRVEAVDLPLLMAEAKRKTPKLKPVTATDNALVVLWSDLQVGKVDHRGGMVEFVARTERMSASLVEKVREVKPSKILFCDLGDTVEGFNNAAPLNQLQSNDLSIMQQVDLATTIAWETLKTLAALVPDVTYVSVGSNHCQWRSGREQIGKPTDDWGVFIGRQLARLAGEQNLPIRFVEPQEWDESLCVDVFDDGFHLLGVVHGHQAKRPDMVATWWRQQAFGNQPVSAATTLVHGHFHHLRVTEMGSTDRGTSRFLVSAATMDNGSNWWRRIAGEDSVPGLVCFALGKGQDFTGTVWKL